MDMVAFKASLKNQWPLHWFKMPTMTIRDNVYYNMWYVPFEWRGNTTNDPKTNMFDVIKGNGFLKLKFFFLTWSFCLQTCKLVCSILENKDSKQLKGEKKTKTSNLHFYLILIDMFDFLGLKITIMQACVHVFLSLTFKTM
jgi:hypothetical protein